MIYATDLDTQISIGALSQRITIRRESVTETNELDEVTDVTVTDAEVWAYVETNPNPENELLAKETVVDMRKVIIRGRDVKVTDTVLIGTDVFDIVRVVPIARGRYIEMIIKKVN